MDVAYNQHADRARRKNRSSTNINHLTLAPLTVKLPLTDADDLPDALLLQHQQQHWHQQPPRSAGTTSYLEGKSAPTTPRLLSRSATPSRSRSHARMPSAPTGSIAKSKSSTFLAGPFSSASGTSARRPTTPGSATPRSRRKGGDDGLAPRDRNDSDWMLRAGALMSSEAREYKGQTWLVSRQSSTSLTAMRDEEEEAFEQELERERSVAAASRRGSSAFGTDDDYATPNGNGSRVPSRFNSRSHSLGEHHRSASHASTPFDQHHAHHRRHPSGEGSSSYFPSQSPSHPEADMPGPDFVNLDEKLEELERDTTFEDEDAVRRLVRREHAGKGGSWIANVIGWSLFSVDENGEEEEDDDDEDDDGSLMDEDEERPRTGRTGWSERHFEGVSNVPLERIPPPASDEGGWKDAAWLLSVASKVVF
ncbi:phospholipase C-like protein [Purpureocillium lavendulum]|uniref:Phospholipase C-like protein n=1 Tax=Purpureocillium lavendulum TaxID=1247861 RepID=A0AB34FNR1_9HYPO|nr:phospholipase C-like protein [Purpureocillium lavendulum]